MFFFPPFLWGIFSFSFILNVLLITYLLLYLIIYVLAFINFWIESVWMNV